MKVPHKTIFKNISNSDYIIAKSGVMIATSNGQKPITGFAVGKLKEDIALRSEYEMYERFFSSYEIFSTLNPNIQSHEVLNLSGMPKEESILSNKVLFNVPKNQTMLDANGLAAHSKENLAIENGLMEVLERHILYMIWYGDYKLYEISSEYNELFSIKTFSTCDSLPFAITVIKYPSRNILLVGSALSFSLKKAIKKSIQEAYMILDNFMSLNRHSLKHINIVTLDDPILYTQRYLHLKQRVTKSYFKETSVLTLNDILVALNFDKDDCSYVRIFLSEYISVVRCFINGAKNTKFDKVQGVVENPFC